MSTSATIENSTFQGNKANGSPGFGGAMRIFGTFQINSCTIAENQAAGWGGGIFVAGSASNITLSNSLLMDNTGTDLGNGWNINVTLSHGSNNLQWPTTRGGAGPADTPARPTITCQCDAPASRRHSAPDDGDPRGSPAIDSGNNFSARHRPAGPAAVGQPTRAFEKQ